ncbi:MAG: hypothetical protein HQ500_05760 [Flavobacteriales bacterium]|nr:hypothetical protein [Flavobacteriales bacterium]
MLNLLLSLLLLLVQDDRIEFQLTNASAASIKVEIPGFRSMVLGQDQFSEVRFHPGQEVYSLQDVDLDGLEERLLLFIVLEEHRGAIIKVDKRLKKAQRAYLSRR